MNCLEYNTLSEGVKDLDAETKEELGEILDRILGKIKERDPEGYERAMKRAEADIERIKNNGGKISDEDGRISSEASGCS